MLWAYKESNINVLFLCLSEGEYFLAFENYGKINYSLMEKGGMKDGWTFHGYIRESC